VKVSISPIAGDNTANIQNAINQVAAMPLDANGFRGTVLLNAGIYPCSNTITINVSGIVLRGVGSSTNGTGTVLQATASNAYTLQGTANSGGSQRATLDLSGLGNFTAMVDQVLIGVAGPVNRPTGTLYFGKTNIVTASGSPGILAADSGSNSGGQNLIYLGQTNAIFADSLTIARQKANASLRFNSAFANAAAIFRGADGSSRVGAWMIADNSLQSTARVPRWARMTLAADGSMPWWIQWCLEKTKRRRAQTALAC